MELERIMGVHDYRVTINMSQATLTALMNSGNYLFGFKAVKNSDMAGRPLVWLKTQKLFPSTVVSWTNQYWAYTSGSNIVNGHRIDVNYAAQMAPGQTLQVQAGGGGTTINTGSPSAISIQNTTTTQFTCGLTENSSDTPICAFPLFGNNLQIITLLEQILLLFSTQQMDLGTVVETVSGGTSSAMMLQSYSPGLLIDLTGETERTVSYDINEGWQWGGYTWATPVSTTSNLVPILILGQGFSS
jgi:hypothetical protein